METPLVSVCMTTYNHEPYIAEAIESVLAQQTSFGVELVVGEDCSTDRTAAICREYAAKYPDRIRLVTSPENVGWRANYRRTFEACRGKYVAYLDGDDWWCDPRKLQMQADLMESDPGCGMCYTRASNYWQASDRTEPDHSDHYTDFGRLLCSLTIANCATLARRELIARYYAEVRPEEHPEWMLDAGTDAYLFDLGNPKALEWFCDQIGELIEQNGIDYYRQDFNMEPDIFWQKNDEPGRTGIREIRHIEGLYAFWDYLRQRFPGLLVDNCASGGRRIDLEATSRSAPMWRTDYNYGEPVGYQCHTYGLEMYLPQHGTGVQKTDKFTFRSSLGTSVVYNWKITNGSSSFYEIQDCMKEFREVRPYFYEDYYPLTGLGDLTGDDVWLAYQLNKPSDGTGIVVAFRRKDNPQDSTVVKLRGLDPQQVYSVQNGNDGKIAAKTGKELADGLTLEIGEAPGSLLLKYSPAGK